MQTEPAITDPRQANCYPIGASLKRTLILPSRTHKRQSSRTPFFPFAKQSQKTFFCCIDLLSEKKETDKSRYFCFLTWELNLCLHPLTMHAKANFPPWVGTCFSSQELEQDCFPKTLQPSQRHWYVSSHVKLLSSISWCWWHTCSITWQAWNWIKIMAVWELAEIDNSEENNKAWYFVTHVVNAGSWNGNFSPFTSGKTFLPFFPSQTGRRELRCFCGALNTPYDLMNPFNPLSREEGIK